MSEETQRIYLPHEHGEHTCTKVPTLTWILQKLEHHEVRLSAVEKLHEAIIDLTTNVAVLNVRMNILLSLTGVIGTAIIVAVVTAIAKLM